MTSDKAVWFGLCCVAAFGTGFGTAILSDVTHEKAIATGIVAMCTYIAGRQQAPLGR